VRAVALGGRFTIGPPGAGSGAGTVATWDVPLDGARRNDHVDTAASEEVASTPPAGGP